MQSTSVNGWWLVAGKCPPVAIAVGGAAEAGPYQKKLVGFVRVVCGVRVGRRSVGSLFHAQIEPEAHEGYPAPGEGN